LIFGTENCFSLSNDLFAISAQLSLLFDVGQITNIRIVSKKSGKGYYEFKFKRLTQGAKLSGN